jgi:hypothetical protein
MMYYILQLLLLQKKRMFTLYINSSLLRAVSCQQTAGLMSNCKNQRSTIISVVKISSINLNLESKK